MSTVGGDQPDDLHFKLQLDRNHEEEIVAMGIYLLNGWLPAERIGTFTLIFIAAFAVIWLIIYVSIQIKVNRINQKMQA